MSLRNWLFYEVLRLDQYKKRKKWREDNPQNFSEIGTLSYLTQNISVGRGTYGTINMLNDRDDRYLSIGNFCSIAPEVMFIVGRDHEMRRISTFPFKQRYELCDPSYRDAISKGDIIVDDDVWIGYGATILSGVHIGQGAVISARSVVTSDVPPYAVVGETPAKVIKYRFDEQKIRYLLTLDYAALTEELFSAHLDELYMVADEMTVEELQEAFAWFPKKKEE